MTLSQLSCRDFHPCKLRSSQTVHRKLYVYEFSIKDRSFPEGRCFTDEYLTFSEEYIAFVSFKKMPVIYDHRPLTSQRNRKTYSVKWNCFSQTFTHTMVHFSSPIFPFKIILPSSSFGALLDFGATEE